MNPLSQNNYDLNAVLKGYDLLITNKTPEQVVELGDSILDFLD